MSLRAEAISNAEIGYFRVFFRVPGQSWFEVTMFRGAGCQVGSLESGDPFGDSSCSITFPQITAFDQPGQGDLWWLVPYADVDIVWENVGGADYEWEWEGFVVSEQVSFGSGDGGLEVECKGALYQGDNYLAAPWFPSRPVPYELLISDALSPRSHPGLRTTDLVIDWPDDWDRRVPEFDQESYLRFLRPWGVTTGQRWTGLTTRSTGGWDPILTGFVQGLLSVMFDQGGAQWTVMKRRGRKPVLRLRRPVAYTDPNLIRVQLGDPGVELQMTRDFTQSANVIYGEGQDTAGTTFSGVQISNDGQRTSYRPYAYSPYVHPKINNARTNLTMARKEAQIKFPSGLDETAATAVAQAQLQRFADPGFTGTITMKTDPSKVDGTVFPRFLIRGGDAVVIEGIRGSVEGMLAHITKVSVSVDDGTTTLTFDTKYRDQLTVAEVRARTLDSLTPLRSLQVGKFSNTTQDLLKPWSYAAGSGCIPSTGVGGKDATHFFNDILPGNAVYPWESWTTRHPPKDAHSAKFYIKIGPPDLADTRNNWSGYSNAKDKTRKKLVQANGWLERIAYPIRMAQAGTIRLVQIAAYDRDGHIMPVRFHVSLYTGGRSEGITQDAMPHLPKPAPGDPAIKLLGPDNNTYRQTRNTGQSQPNPFFQNAFEQYLPDGLQPSADGQLYSPASGANMVVGWGNFYEPAGYWPGRGSKNAPKTGLLVDESSWSFNTEKDSNISDYKKEGTKKNPDAGNMYIMIYCDDRPPGRWDEPVFFLGRAFRQEPGT